MPSKAFEFISRRGHDIARQRAKEARTDYADRESRRSKPDGYKIMSDGKPGSDLSVDSFFKDMDLVAQYRPWWLKIALRLHWWMESHGPRATRSAIKTFWQRGQRGWAESDTWSFDSYLAVVIRDGVRHLNEIKHGWPGEPMTYEEWGQILDEIAEGMQAHLDIMDIPPIDEVPALEAKRDLAFDHLKAHWGSLWD